MGAMTNDVADAGTEHGFLHVYVYAVGFVSRLMNGLNISMFLN